MFDINAFEIIGYVAAALSSISFLPQVVKTWRTKSARDLSWLMLVIFMLGLVLWEIYGIWIRSMPMILVNLLLLSSASVILVCKIRYDRRATDVDQ